MLRQNKSGYHFITLKYKQNNNYTLPQRKNILAQGNSCANESRKVTAVCLEHSEAKGMSPLSGGSKWASGKAT